MRVFIVTSKIIFEFVSYSTTINIDSTTAKRMLTSLCYLRFVYFNNYCKHFAVYIKQPNK